MSKEREALKLEFDILFAEHQKLLGELQAMKALAQPEQEPFAFVDECGQMRRYTKQDFNQVEYGGLQRLYTTPPQRAWVGLTDEERNQVAWSCGAMSADWLEFADAIEAKLKEKNT